MVGQETIGRNGHGKRVSVVNGPDSKGKAHLFEIVRAGPSPGATRRSHYRWHQKASDDDDGDDDEEKLDEGESVRFGFGWGSVHRVSVALKRDGESSLKSGMRRRISVFCAQSNPPSIST